MQKMQPPQHYFGGFSRKTGNFAGLLGNNYVRLVCAINPMVGWGFVLMFCYYGIQNSRIISAPLLFGSTAKRTDVP